MKLRVPFKMLSHHTPPFKVTSNNAVLLLMDVQRFTTVPDEGLGAVAQERGIMREFQEYYAQVDAALRNLAKLVPACRAHGLPVLHTFLHAQEPDRSDLTRQLRISGLPIPTGDPGAQLRPEFVIPAEDIVLPRGTLSPFTSTALVQSLTEAGCDTILLAGMLANTTVALAAQEAADHGFGVIVVWDGSASETLDWHDNMKTRIVGPLIRVRTATQVIELMEGTRT